MRVGINARYLQYKSTGITKYLLNLVLSLKDMEDRNEYILFFNGNEPIPGAILDAGFDYDLLRLPASRNLKGLLAHLYLPGAIKRNKIDIFHEPFYIAPVFKRCPVVITIHDLAYMHIPSGYTRLARMYLKGLLWRSIRHADLIIAVSKSTKNDIIDNFAVPEDKIRVIYEGVDEIFRPIDDMEGLEQVKRRYGIKKDFILTVSLISPRKNIVRLIRAFKLLRDRGERDAQLVIVGRKGWMYEEVFREVASSRLEEDVIFCGYVPRRDLLFLYNSAAFFAYPSLYEGFGLPLLEAMACGCPVVASNRSSIPEVCGRAASLVDPDDTEELAAALADIKHSGLLRQDLVKKGFEQVKKFSWKKAADETSAAYAAVRSHQPGKRKRNP